MTETQAIAKVESMDVFERQKIYGAYFVNSLFNKYTSPYYKEFGTDRWTASSFEDFCDAKNIQKVVIPFDDWQKRGFASKEWVTLNSGSIYHYVYHNIK